MAALKKILPSDWNIQITSLDLKNLTINSLISEDRTIQEVILKIAQEVRAKVYFYPQIKVLVIAQDKENKKRIIR